jgi:hypothetical protein
VTAAELARELGISAKALRHWLRLEWPRLEPGRRWYLTPEQIEAARRRWMNGKAPRATQQQRAPATANPESSNTTDAWTRPALEAAGFIGWVPWSACPDALKTINTEAGGVYVVYREATNEPDFLEKSPAGTWRGDPTASLDSLSANWVPGAHAVYIGKADPKQLRRRLKDYVLFGRGGKARHSGGRLIWQLPDSEDLLVAWHILPTNAMPLDEETKLRTAFRTDYGKPPFANDPHLLGK